MDKEEVKTQKLATTEFSLLIDTDNMSNFSKESTFVAIEEDYSVGSFSSYATNERKICRFDSPIDASSDNVIVENAITLPTNEYFKPYQANDNE